MKKKHSQDEYFMMAALRISKKAIEHCAPNPPVGCVIVSDNVIVAEGFTHPPGEPHAEAHALLNLSNEYKNLVLYTTLEPCAFLGRTPSCAKTIAKDARIRKVVVGVIDPDSRNNGKGILILEANNKKVVIGVCEKEIDSFLSPYLFKLQ